MSEGLFYRAEAPSIPISELNQRARALLENSVPPLWVIGEISNLTRHASGHWYFSLKDERAQVRCVMFRHRNQHVEFQPKEGLQVEARALVTLYEPRGDFQLNVEQMRPAGLGALYEAFAQLKAKLEREGLFDAARKRLPPAHPRQIGVVTSPQAAALRDVLTTLARRMPNIPVVVYPTPVQGKGAHAQIAAAIRRANARQECDVLILCRGGGSIEDLWEFNTEPVARAIVASAIPIVCGVGHETDFTIADFAADRRAPTPTAAAELASPDRSDLAQRLDTLTSRLIRGMTRQEEMRMQRVDYLARRLLHPGERIRQQVTVLAHLARRLRHAFGHAEGLRAWRVQHLATRLTTARPTVATYRIPRDHLAARLALAMEHRIAAALRETARLGAHLQHLNPQAILERGYSIARDASGQVVSDGKALQPGDEVALTFARGTARARITDVA